MDILIEIQIRIFSKKYLTGNEFNHRNNDCKYM